jgi:pimeloyl-ACP methyl ester carboxylesterase
MIWEELLAGVASTTVKTPRLATHLLHSGPQDGIPVLFVHGNVSGGRFFGETLAALPGYRGFAPDLRGFGASERKPLDATRGVVDFSDDLYALVGSLGLGERPVHLVGWSVGGPVAMRYAVDPPAAVASLVLLNPMSPSGFGGTRGEAGTPCWPDFAGSGGGTANPEFVGRLAAKDRSEDDPNSPRNVTNNMYFAPPFKSPRERQEVLLSSKPSTKTGADHYPGDMTTSGNRPGATPARGA